jgi:ribosomal protein S27AE
LAAPRSRWARYFIINLLVSLVLLVMSIVFLGMGITQIEAFSNNQWLFGLFELALGSVGAYVSYNMLSSTLKLRSSVGSKIIDKLVTVETCPQCGFKEERPYVEGDYVRKESTACSKCGTTKRIAAVFVEKPITPVTKTP